MAAFCQKQEEIFLQSSLRESGKTSGGRLTKELCAPNTESLGIFKDIYLFVLFLAVSAFSCSTQDHQCDSQASLWLWQVGLDAPWHVEPQCSDQGSNPCPLHQKTDSQLLDYQGSAPHPTTCEFLTLELLHTESPVIHQLLIRFSFPDSSSSGSFCSCKLYSLHLSVSPILRSSSLSYDLISLIRRVLAFQFVQLFSCEDRSDDFQAPCTLDCKLEVLCIPFSVCFLIFQCALFIF